MTTEFTSEDARVLGVLERLNGDGTATPDETALAREYTELLGLLPYGLEPMTPRAEVWRRIRAEVAADAAANAAAPKAPLRLAESPRGENTLVPFPGRQEPARDLSSDRRPPAATLSRSGRQAVYALAATLAVCLLGLGYLLARTQFQQSALDELRGDLTLAQNRYDDLLRVRDQYTMVTRTARQYYPMRPAALAPQQDPLYGRVWVCGLHQQWLLNVEGIAPAPEGYEYRFWFETKGGKVPAGVVQVEDGVGRLGASSMPDGTTGFSVTLEPRDGDARDSSGRDSSARNGEARVILHSDDAQEILLGLEGRDLDPDSPSF